MAGGLRGVRGGFLAVRPLRWQRGTGPPARLLDGPTPSSGTGGTSGEGVPQVLHVCGVPPAGRSELWAEVLQHWPTGVASHQGTLHLLGVNGAPPGNAVTIGPRSNWPYAGIESHRIADLRPRHRTTIDGLSCTTVAHCLVDLASTVHLARLRHLLDEVVLARRLIGDHEVARVLAEVNPGGRRNLANIATLVDERSAGKPTPWSALEARLDANSCATRPAWAQRCSRRTAPGASNSAPPERDVQRRRSIIGSSEAAALGPRAPFAVESGRIPPEIHREAQLANNPP